MNFSLASAEFLPEPNRVSHKLLTALETRRKNQVAQSSAPGLKVPSVVLNDDYSNLVIQNKLVATDRSHPFYGFPVKAELTAKNEAAKKALAVIYDKCSQPTARKRTGPPPIVTRLTQGPSALRAAPETWQTLPVITNDSSFDMSTASMQSHASLDSVASSMAFTPQSSMGNLSVVSQLSRTSQRLPSHPQPAAPVRAKGMARLFPSPDALAGPLAELDSVLDGLAPLGSLDFSVASSTLSPALSHAFGAPVRHGHGSIARNRPMGRPSRRTPPSVGSTSLASLERSQLPTPRALHMSLSTTDRSTVFPSTASSAYASNSTEPLPPLNFSLSPTAHASHALDHTAHSPVTQHRQPSTRTRDPRSPPTRTHAHTRTQHARTPAPQTHTQTRQDRSQTQQTRTLTHQNRTQTQQPHTGNPYPRPHSARTVPSSATATPHSTTATTTTPTITRTNTNTNTTISTSGTTTSPSTSSPAHTPTAACHIPTATPGPRHPQPAQDQSTADSVSPHRLLAANASLAALPLSPPTALQLDFSHDLSQDYSHAHAPSSPLSHISLGRRRQTPRNRALSPLPALATPPPHVDARESTDAVTDTATASAVSLPAAADLCTPTHTTPTLTRGHVAAPVSSSSFPPAHSATHTATHTATHLVRTPSDSPAASFISSPASTNTSSNMPSDSSFTTPTQARAPSPPHPETHVRNSFDRIPSASLSPPPFIPSLSVPVLAPFSPTSSTSSILADPSARRRRSTTPLNEPAKRSRASPDASQQLVAVVRSVPVRSGVSNGTGMGAATGTAGTPHARSRVSESTTRVSASASGVRAPVPTTAACTPTSTSTHRAPPSSAVTARGSASARRRTVRDVSPERPRTRPVARHSTAKPASRSAASILDSSLPAPQRLAFSFTSDASDANETRISADTGTGTGAGASMGTGAAGNRALPASGSRNGAGMRGGRGTCPGTATASSNFFNSDSDGNSSGGGHRRREESFLGPASTAIQRRRHQSSVTPATNGSFTDSFAGDMDRSFAVGRSFRARHLSFAGASEESFLMGSVEGMESIQGIPYEESEEEGRFF